MDRKRETDGRWIVFKFFFFIYFFFFFFVDHPLCWRSEVI